MKEGALIITTAKEIKNIYEKFINIQNSGNKKFSKLTNWLKKESNLFEEEIKNNTNIFLRYKRGQIIKVDFGVNIGSELSHTHFAIVLNSDDTKYTDNVTVLPLTSKKGYKRIYLGNIVSKIFNSDKYQNITYGAIPQIKTISKKRILLNNTKYTCNEKTLKKIDKSIVEYLTNDFYNKFTKRIDKEK